MKYKIIILFAVFSTIQNLSSQEKKIYEGSYKSGFAKYQYFENKEYERIFDGYFKFVSEKGELSIDGIYKNNIRDGAWVFTDNQLNNYFSRKLFLSKGNYLNGKKNGIWSYIIKSKDLKNQDLKTVKYRNDTLIDVKLDLNHLKGEIDNKGNFIGEWMYYSFNEDRENFIEFKNNIVVKYLSRTKSTGRLIEKYIPNISTVDFNTLKRNPFSEKKQENQYDSYIVDKNLFPRIFKDDFSANIKNVIFGTDGEELENGQYLQPLAFNVKYFFNEIKNELQKIYRLDKQNNIQLNINDINVNFILKEPELIFKTNQNTIELQTNFEVDNKKEEIDNNKSENIIYNITEVDTKPEFPGGIEQLYKFISSHYQTPEEEGIKGIVIVEFIIEQDGSLSNIKAIKDLDYGTGKESVRVMNKSPKWIPAIKNGENVRVLYSIPITIQSAE